MDHGGRMGNVHARDTPATRQVPTIRQVSVTRQVPDIRQVHTPATRPVSYTHL